MKSDNSYFGIIKNDSYCKKCGIAKPVAICTATVSKALNDQKDVSEETKHRIKKTAEALGYFPNAAARALKTNRSYNMEFSLKKRRQRSYP